MAANGVVFDHTVKIVATIGERTSPAYDKLEEILGQGTIRINLAFCSKERYQELRDLIRRIRTKGGDKINILLDAVGPRVKLGNLGSGVNLKEGAEVVITTQDPKKAATEDRIGTIFKELPQFIKPGDPILLAEGKFKLETVRVLNETDVLTRVVKGGFCKKRGINLPKTDLPVPALSDNDKEDLAELLKEPDVDMVALSFVRNVADVKMLRDFLEQVGRPDVRIMSKIETTPAVENINAIASVSDALMVARGDLWAELENPWSLPSVTCDIIKAGQAIGIPVVTATQTLSSMQTNDLPTRAEVDELYFLISRGTDCIMGSEEFAVGMYPEAVVHSIKAVGKEVDKEIQKSLSVPRYLSSTPLDRELAGIIWAEGTKRIRCICIISSRANYLKEVYRHRPRKPLIAISNHSKSVHYFQLFQVVPVLGKFQVTDDASAIARAALKQLHLFGQHDSALLIVNHTGPDTTKDHHFSRIEEIPLPSSADSLD
ncbi:hypothetical protein EMCRGX_G015244 [Ephydatia muelleri]